MTANLQTFDIFKNETACVQLRNDPDKFQDQVIARIFKCPMSNQRKTLAWRPTKNTINLAATNSCQFPDQLSTKASRSQRDNFGLREIEFVNSTMNRIDLDGGCNIEPCLLKAERHAAGTSEQVHGERSL